MTDLEITRLCAEAMGLGWQDDRTDGGITAQEGTYNYKYDPLHDDAQAMALVKKMRFDGRTEGVSPHEDTFDVVGHHCIMLPSIAAQLVLKLHHLPLHNDDLPVYDYPDLSKHPAFK